MPKGFNLRCAAGISARVWLQGKGERSCPDRPWCSYLYRTVKPMTRRLPIARPLRQALIDDNTGHVNIVVCETDYEAPKRGIEHLPPAVQ
jgi:hypothetical protein